MGERVEERLRKTAYEAYLKLANDLVEGKISKEEFAREQAKEEFESLREAQTGLFNKKFFNQEIELQLARAKRQEEPLSLIIIDLDHLKEINDTYGHFTGDAVLVSLGKLLRNNIRESDVAARIGGEELAILLPATKKDDAIEVAERLMNSIHQTSIETEKGNLQYTVSIGISGFDIPPRDLKTKGLIEKADKALYQAKEKGKDRIEVYG